jgi:hypothetical protein
VSGDGGVVDGGGGHAGSALDALLDASGWVPSGPVSPFAGTTDD